MSQDIELGALLDSSSNSSSEVTLYSRNQPYRPRTHAGYGRSQIPLRPSAAGAFAAGQTQQKIFEGHLGNAAADPNNPIGNWFYDQIYGNQDNLATEHLQDIQTRTKYKPDHLRWNADTRKQYPIHWAKAKKEKQEKAKTVKSGVVLPFSNNIGPGNSIQPARTRADSIAQGHDIHYEHAKKDSDVLSADKEAIDQFIQEYINPENPISQLHAAAGFIGLAAKHGTELLTGKVLYGKYVVTI